MRDIPHSPVALDEVAHLFGTLIAETILASAHVRARKQAGHMGASDLIKALQNLARRGPSTYGESGSRCRSLWRRGRSRWRSAGPGRHGDYREFRAGLGMMGAKEPTHAATQRTSHPGCRARSAAGRRRSENCPGAQWAA